MNAKRKGAAREQGDLVAIFPTDIILCQVKSRNLPGLQERERWRRFRPRRIVRKSSIAGGMGNGCQM